MKKTHKLSSPNSTTNLFKHTTHNPKKLWTSYILPYIKPMYYFLFQIDKIKTNKSLIKFIYQYSYWVKPIHKENDMYLLALIIKETIWKMVRASSTLSLILIFKIAIVNIENTNVKNKSRKEYSLIRTRH